jgi:hypothetical protein
MSLIAFIPIISTIIDKIFPDADAANKAKLELIDKVMESEKAQVAVNQVEAANPSVFVSGWRPALGWICVFAFSFTYVIQPIVNTILIYKGLAPLPYFDSTELYTILMGMLGLGGLRTVEKLKLK